MYNFNNKFPNKVKIRKILEQIYYIINKAKPRNKKLEEFRTFFGIVNYYRI